MTRCRTTGKLFACLLSAVGTLGAQQAADANITISAGFAADRYVASQAPIALSLSRVPAAAEGRIAIFVGTSDVTSLFDAEGTTLVYRAGGIDLPSGESELKVFLVLGAAWNELGKVAIRVLTPHGFQRAIIDPGADLRNAGQLAEGHSGAQAAPDRPTFQSIAATLALQTTHERAGALFTSSAHVLAAGERRDALRFGERGDRASRVDLADYAIAFKGRAALLAVGQVTAGTNRHLINGFSSRGITTMLGGPRALWSVGVENGTSIVGTDNLLGVSHGDHRIISSALAFEFLPVRPGALHLDATVLHGSLQAATGFTQGGVMNADKSDGFGVQVAASTATQRVRLAAGMASSTSQYAADAPLSSGNLLPPPRAHRKGARYAELNVGVLQDHRIFRVVPVTIAVALRHERVDPMYRSVAALTQSDLSRSGYDVTGNVDAVSVQVTQARSSDNLAAVASLLTSRTHSTTVTLGTPLASLLRITRRASYLPVLSVAVQQMHQFGAGIPSGGGWAAGDVPDQVSTVQDASAQWQVKNWQVAYRTNRSLQDNRQPGHTLADLATHTHAVTIGVMAGARLTLGMDLGLERQENRELAQVNHVHRAAMTGNWRATTLTTIDGAVNVSRAEDHGAGTSTHVSGVQAGIARGINLWRASSDAPRGQVYLRLSRQANDLFNLGAPFAPPMPASGSWNVTSGLTLRLF